MSETRNTNGTFAPGNPGGPGRPRRHVELEYLSIVAEVVPLKRWRRIVEAAAVAAEEGDSTARAWLGKHVVGDTPPPLWELARRDVAGVSVDDELQAQAAIDSRTLAQKMFAMSEPTPFEKAIELAQAERDEASGDAERERKERARLIRKVAKESREARAVNGTV